MLGPPSGINAGFTPSGINAGSAQAGEGILSVQGSGFGARQAGQTPGLRAAVKRDEYWVCEQLPSGINAGFVFPPFRSAATFPGTHEKNASIFFMGAPSPASGGRDFPMHDSGLGACQAG